MCCCVCFFCSRFGFGGGGCRIGLSFLLMRTYIYIYRDTRMGWYRRMFALLKATKGLRKCLGHTHFLRRPSITLPSPSRRTRRISHNWTTTSNLTHILCRYIEPPPATHKLLHRDKCSCECFFVVVVIFTSTHDEPKRNMTLYVWTIVYFVLFFAEGQRDVQYAQHERFVRHAREPGCPTRQHCR